MLRIVAKGARYCDRFRNLRVNVIAMTALAAAVAKSSFLEIGNEFPDLGWHVLSACAYVA